MWEQLGETYKLQGDLDASVSAFENALKRNPKNATVSSKLSNAYLAKHEDKRAIELLETTIRRYPVKSLPTVELTAAYSASSDNVITIDAIQRAVGVFSKVPSVWRHLGPRLRQGLGEAFKAKGNFQDALSALDSGIDEFPEDIDLWIAVSDTNLAAGNYGDAIRVLENILEKHPKELRLYIKLCAAYVANGEENKAVRALERRFEMDPSNTELLPITWVEEITHAKECDNCTNRSPIRGYLYHCKTCHGFDLCSRCFRRAHYLHAKHEFLAIPSTKWMSEHCELGA
jgi:tetratricopeptide (TPR) repeat protein